MQQKRRRFVSGELPVTWLHFLTISCLFNASTQMIIVSPYILRYMILLYGRRPFKLEKEVKRASTGLPPSENSSHVRIIRIFMKASMQNCMFLAQLFQSLQLPGPVSQDPFVFGCLLWSQIVLPNFILQVDIPSTLHSEYCDQALYTGTAETQSRAADFWNDLCPSIDRMLTDCVLGFVGWKMGWWWRWWFLKSNSSQQGSRDKCLCTVFVSKSNDSLISLANPLTGLRGPKKERKL